MCFFNELSKEIEIFIIENSCNKKIVTLIYDFESDTNEIYYSNIDNFDRELEKLFNKYFYKYDEKLFEMLLITIYNIYLINKFKINKYYCSTFNIKNINIED